MSRFLRGAARAVTRVLRHASDPRPYSGLFLASSFPSGPGHLGLVRSRPALRDLNALLTPEAFLLDATCALGATAFRVVPYTGEAVRLFRDVVSPKALAMAEAQGKVTTAESGRIHMALVEEALRALACLAADRPHSPRVRLCAAAVCDLLGRVDESEQWLATIPQDAGHHSPGEDMCFQLGLVAATLGGAPGAVAGSQARVASAAFRLINKSANDGGMSLSQVIITGLLKRAAARACTDDPTALKRDGILRSAGYAIKALLGSGSRDPEAATFFVLETLQALLSAAVLRAAPLSGERVRAAARVAERDLARAVEERDAATAASLRLLLGFLAVRDGRFGDALERYAEAARDDPSDPWPRYLAHILCLFVGRKEESDKWEASFDSLDPGSTEEQVALFTLSDELQVALALGGLPLAFSDQCPGTTCRVIGAAAGRVDAALISALRNKEMPVLKWLEVRAVRAFLHAWAWSTRKELKCKINNGSSDAAKE
ncbi:hypothetical protein EJB05_15765, partial [Eragrostis curvula]